MPTPVYNPADWDPPVFPGENPIRYHSENNTDFSFSLLLRFRWNIVLPPVLLLKADSFADSLR